MSELDPPEPATGLEGDAALDWSGCGGVESSSRPIVTTNTTAVTTAMAVSRMIKNRWDRMTDSRF
ncbi:hypothetical protein ACWEKT_32380 [Nocardia takedensis]